MTTYDAIVLGTGGVGSAALWHLAKRGMNVLGVDRFAPPHNFGSSHGQSRIIRQAYFEHPDYTPLLIETYRLWEELAAHTGQQLYKEVGVLQLGPPDGEVLPGVLESARTHNLQVEELAAGEVEQRWPALRVPHELAGVFEPHAGLLFVERCVAAHRDAAKNAGAELLSEVEVQAWQPGPPVTLETSAGTFTAQRLIVTAGAWAAQLLADLQLNLEVRRKSMFWHAPPREHSERYDQLPCFLYELPEGVFYGVPQLDERGVKIAEHSGGRPVADPLRVDRTVDADDIARSESFVRAYVPDLQTPHTNHCVCLYTMTPDEHFVVDTHPDHPHVAFAAGLSGHGFKFAPVLGRALTELVLNGGTDLPIGFLRRR